MEEEFKLQYPLKYISVNQNFGENANGTYAALGLKGHDGIDFFALDSTPVYAAHDGRVSFTGYDSSGGLGVKIRTEGTYDYSGQKVYFETIYWHLKKDNVKVLASQSVKAGDLIALSDNTGLSTGSHLHFALSPKLRPSPYDFEPIDPSNGYRGYIDPSPYLPKPSLFHTSMVYGDKSPEVEKLQIFLSSKGYLTFPAGVGYGYFGPLTAKAVVGFQVANSILDFKDTSDLTKVRVGPKTLKVLASLTS